MSVLLRSLVNVLCSPKNSQTLCIPKRNFVSSLRLNAKFLRGSASERKSFKISLIINNTSKIEPGRFI